MGQDDPVTNGPRSALLIRRRTAGAFAAAAVFAAGLLIAVDQNAVAAAPTGQVPAAQAPAAQALAAPVTTTATSNGGTGEQAILTVNPATGLTAAGASIKVTGAAFDPAGGLYVAICHLNGNALPNLRSDCVGGPIPAANTSTSWAHISTSGVAVPGQVAAKWGDGGTFSVELTLPPSDTTSDALDCSKVVCAVVTAPDAQTSDTSQDLSVPLTYQAVVTSTTATTTSSSTSTSSSPTTTSQQVITSTVAVVGTTVQPKTIGSPSVAAGGKQQVLFAGFAKNEPVAVTLYSEPIKLPNTTADADGIVNIQFTVPATLPPGTHLLKAVGQTSKVTGVATFEVTAPVVASSSTPTPSSTAATSAPASSALVVPLPVSSAAAPSSAAQSSRPVAVVVVKKTTSRLVWPWYVLAVVVLLWAVFAVFLVQRRRKRLAAENREKERILAEAAAAEQQRAADALAAANSNAPTSYIGPPTDAPGDYLGYHPGEHGLLSGRDHPDNPGMMSGRGDQPGSEAEPPTTSLPHAGDPASPSGPPAAAGERPGATQGGPPTGAWTPDFAGPTSPGSGPTPPGATRAGSTAPQAAVSPSDPSPGSTSAAGQDVDGSGTSEWQPNFDDDDETDTGAPPAGGRH
jgi:hypothetical protein